MVQQRRRRRAAMTQYVGLRIITDNYGDRSLFTAHAWKRDQPKTGNRRHDQLSPFPPPLTPYAPRGVGPLPRPSPRKWGEGRRGNAGNGNTPPLALFVSQSSVSPLRSRGDFRMRSHWVTGFVLGGIAAMALTAHAQSNPQGDPKRPCRRSRSARRRGRRCARISTSPSAASTGTARRTLSAIPRGLRP